MGNYCNDHADHGWRGALQPRGFLCRLGMDDCSTQERNNTGMKLWSTPKNTKMMFLRGTALLKPSHVDTCAVNTVLELTHLPGRRQIPGLPCPSLWEAINLEIREVCRVSREEAEEHPSMLPAGWQ